MDDDFKINISKPEVKLFLGDQVCPSDLRSANTYDLESEFAKTKRNKSNTVIVTLIITAVCIGLLSFFVSVYIKKQNEKVSVNVEAFDDLNLKQLLDSVSRIQNELNLALTEKSKIDATYKSEVEKAEQTRDSDIYVLDSMKLSKAELNTRKAEIVGRCKNIILDLDEKYEKDSADIDRKIADLTNQLAALDSANLERAQQQQAELDSQRQVYELEKNQLVTEYESLISNLNAQMQEVRETSFEERKKAVDTITAKYRAEINALDPIIRDETANSYVSAANKNFANEEQPDFSSILMNETLSEKTKFLLDSIQQKYNNFNYISAFVTGLPQENSIPSFSKAMQELTNSMGNDMELLVGELIAVRSSAQDEALNLKKLVDAYNFYIDTQLKSAGDAGYVLDPRNPQKIVVYLSPLYSADVDNTKAFIFRKADEYIGSVVLVKEAVNFVAVPDSEAVGRLIQPGDRIMIDMNNKQGVGNE